MAVKIICIAAESKLQGKLAGNLAIVEEWKIKSPDVAQWHDDIAKKLSEFILSVLPLSQFSPVNIEEYRHFNKLRPKGYETWLYQDTVYGVSDFAGYSEDAKKLLVLEFVDKERQKFERLSTKFSREQAENIKYERTRIPEQVRVEVWRRDQGKCASCGSREKLEYDHIVPVTRGGSNTARNVELLCENCNRAKGNRIQ